ncbi:hypothetical protein L484_020055 [Morus notabilis]|uniref:Uncharacterized protein n=1 Tax=Morus notabilis TaxID=981085 RepID=W9SBX5_9ROSA|nr:hypothetical protein L484_020055 [Morus notabilis]
MTSYKCELCAVLIVSWPCDGVADAFHCDHAIQSTTTMSVAEKAQRLSPERARRRDSSDFTKS